MNGAVFVPATFAGGEIRHFNRILWAWARGGDDLTVVVHPPRNGATPPLGLLGPEGDLLALPAPEGGVFADPAARRAWAAAILDWLPELRAEAAATVEAMLPAPGEEPPAATVALWRATFPTLRVEVGDPPDHPEAGEDERPSLVWVGEHQRRAAAELGTTPEEALRTARRADDAEGADAPPSGPPLERRLRSLRSEVAERLDELVELATTADLGLHGPARRTRRLALRELDALAERLANAEAHRRGIRSRRTRRLLQALAPDGRPQEEALSLLAARALFRLPAVVDDRFLARVRERTTAWAGESGEALVLEA